MCRATVLHIPDATMPGAYLWAGANPFCHCCHCYSCCFVAIVATNSSPTKRYMLACCVYIISVEMLCMHSIIIAFHFDYIKAVCMCVCVCSVLLYVRRYFRCRIFGACAIVILSSLASAICLLYLRPPVSQLKCQLCESLYHDPGVHWNTDGGYIFPHLKPA